MAVSIEAHLKVVLDTVIDGIITIDDNAIIQSANPAAERIFGYRVDELVGENVNMLMPEPYSSQHDQYVENYLRSGNAKIIGSGREVVGKRKDGSTFPLDLAVSEMRVEGKCAFVGIVRDITERKISERSLAEKNREIEDAAGYERTLGRIMALFSSSFDQAEILQLALGIIADCQDIPVSAVYLYDEWNGMLNRVAGYGLPADLPAQISPGSTLIGQAVAGKKMICIETGDEMPFNIETGLFGITPAAVIASPITYTENVMGVLVMASVTPFNDRDRNFIARLCDQIGVALNNIKQFHDLKVLTEQLKQRGNEITQKNAQLRQANRLKTEFLANMSHELRTPLNAVIGFSEVLKDKLLGELNAEQSDYAGEIFSSANHLLSLINDILDLSKIEAGKMELNRSTVDIHLLCKNALSIVKEQAYSNKIQLNVTVDDEISAIEADGRKLKQIIYNLLSNAVKFTPELGSVKLSCQRVGDWLEVIVTDTGIGIEASQISQLFQPFQQLDGSLARKYEGTGLGLVMVKRLVELHGGNVSVESTPGKGSQFSFVIPYIESSELTNNLTAMSTLPSGIQTNNITNVNVEEALLPQRSTAGLAEQPLVLLVEDNDAAAQLLSQHLMNAGYRTLRASSGGDGLRLASDHQPAIVILDILLPDIEGWDVIRRMKQSDSLVNIPILVVSIVADKTRGLALGALEVLEKPVNKTDLLAAVQRILPLGSAQRSVARILVVDDDTAALEALLRHLNKAGYQVSAAGGGQPAIDFALSTPPDLIILDLMMPDITGFDVIARLHDNIATRNIPIIVITAKILSDEDRALIRGRVSHIVNKRELDLQALLDDVKRVIGVQAPISGSSGIKRQSMPGEAGEKALVLVVEDNNEQAALLSLYFQDAGLRVIRACNGHEALHRLEEERPDLITLDLLMPAMDGFSFLESKALRPELAGIPVVVLSAAADKVGGSPFIADAVLSKPIRRSEILAIIDEILSLELETGKDNNLTVLLIDDDPKAIKIVSSYISDKDFQVITAFNGMDGLEMARNDGPNLIILDLMMPAMNGFDVLAELRRLPETRDIPVIILTAKLLSQKERDELMKEVAIIAQKGDVSIDRLADDVQRILGRLQPKWH